MVAIPESHGLVILIKEQKIENLMKTFTTVHVFVTMVYLAAFLFDIRLVVK